MTFPARKYFRQSNDAWSEKKITTLKVLASEGLPASKIAAELGVTKSAVVGKCHRAGIILLNGQRKKQPRARRRKRNEMFIFAGLMSEPKPSRPLPMTEPKPQTKPHVHFLDLTKHSCRWPIEQWGSDGLRLFCGETALAGYPYCAWHVKVAYHSSQVWR